MEKITLPLFALFAVLPFYIPQFWFLSLFAFVPLFVNRSFRAFFLFGSVFSLLLLFPLSKAFFLVIGNPFVALLAFLSVVFIFSLLQFGLSYILTRLGIFLPLAYAVAEIFRTFFPFNGFPYFKEGTVFAQIPLFGLNVHLFTLYGGTFLVLLVNYLLFKIFENWESKRESYLSLLLGLFVFLLTGALYVKKNLSLPYYGVKIALVQPFLEQEDKLQKEEFVKLYTTYLATEAALLSDLVFLPETALPAGEGPKDFAAAFPKNIFLFGKSELVYDFDTFRLYAQNVVYFAKYGLVYDRYVKKILVPFGEYTPCGFRFLERIIPYLGNVDYRRGKYEKVFLVKGIKIEPKICNELFYPFRPLGDIVALFSNEGWFFAPFTRYTLEEIKAKSIETGKIFIFVNNNGFSGIVYPDGSYVGNPSAKIQILQF